MANLCLEFFPDKTHNHQIIRLFCSLGTYLSFPESKKKKKKCHWGDTNSVRVGKKKSMRNGNSQNSLVLKRRWEPKDGWLIFQNLTIHCDFSESLATVFPEITYCDFSGNSSRNWDYAKPQQIGCSPKVPFQILHQNSTVNIFGLLFKSRPNSSCCRNRVPL